MLINSYDGFDLYNLENDKPEIIWTNKDLKANFQTYVISGKFMYGFCGPSDKKFQCISLSSGEIKWQTKLEGGSAIISNDILIIIDKKGKLIFAEASAESYKEISSLQVINLAKKNTKGRKYRRESACWTNPVLCGGKIYVRSTYGELVCVDVGK